MHSINIHFVGHEHAARDLLLDLKVNLHKMKTTPASTTPDDASLSVSLSLFALVCTCNSPVARAFSVASSASFLHALLLLLFLHLHHLFR